MINLIIYSILLILTITSIGTFVYYLINKKINVRDVLFIVSGVVFIGLMFNTIKSGLNIAERISVEFNVPKDLYSEWRQDSLNNPINEKIFYKHLLLMRAPHPKIIYAQAVHESDHFRSSKFKLLRNCFGMKKSESRTTTSDQSKGEFKKYKDWQEACYDYIFWIFSRNADKLSDSEYIEYIGKIYAEDPLYQQKIEKVISTTDFKKLEQ